VNKAEVAAKLLSEPIDDEDLLYDLAQVIHQALSDDKIRSSTFIKDSKILPKLDALLAVPSEKIQEKVISAIIKASLVPENSKELTNLGTDKKLIDMIKINNTELTRKVVFTLKISVYM
jgi:hypothetical protein